MADKLTQQITDALTRAAAEPAGLPLYASKADSGLFPNTAAAKPAAQKCLADDLVRARPAGAGKRELYALTEKGWEHLLAAVNPKQVLEDFVRVLEARQGEVGELLASARSMADSLQGLKDAVARVLPNVCAAKVERARREEPTPQPPPCREGESDLDIPQTFGGAQDVTHEFSPSLQGGGRGVGSALLVEVALAPAAVAYLRDRAAATDCPLPELFRALARDRALTIGEFHDGLRQLCADGQVVLNAWTGPLYAMPEPQYALLSGHSIAYFASLRG